jgi:hypothetical protein
MLLYKLINYILITQSFQLTDSMTKLVINNIKQEDQAIYQCFLSNQAGQISASTMIKIISKYYFK